MHNCIRPKAMSFSEGVCDGWETLFVSAADCEMAATNGWSLAKGNVWKTPDTCLSINAGRECNLDLTWKKQSDDSVKLEVSLADNPMEDSMTFEEALLAIPGEMGMAWCVDAK